MKRLFYMILVAALLAGCTSLKTPEINGVVVDAETERPIEGAYVVASWAPTSISGMFLRSSLTADDRRDGKRQSISG